MKGAIIGDIVGSRLERSGPKTTDFDLFTTQCRFTDDTVLTIAVADAILHQKDYGENIKAYALRYPEAGYGGTFRQWMRDELSEPYASWGNGSAMRVSPVGWLFNDLDRVLAEAEKSALPTHGHPEGIKGAQAIASAIFLARQGAGKEDIRQFITDRFGYRLRRTVEEIRPDYVFDVSCAGSVPEAIIAFLDARDLEDAIRLAVSLGGDTDTQAAMAGCIAEAFFGGIHPRLEDVMNAFLPAEFIDTIAAFDAAMEVG
ncbi:ADP-ribosylglycohydrolase family protein [Neolewinella lacunae]|uniref:ADP-ribosylglycohydrolase family protein n=1 Tax=Neolewinella lacunae TaxID=1517758 RepID=A0A923PQ13_9BACT|nr:ADP-ribosylglycohydrolase family protein [Neolewinella lacunae]MBC6995686.1 ADP-ribosylglycohydrolase family protein [Neolewinella lacunae]MDN3636621.1 ADP-ribosylglycohydrolase family protein [Neolewinella lacunae]